jgi:hypothetical protein
MCVLEARLHSGDNADGSLLPYHLPGVGAGAASRLHLSASRPGWQFTIMAAAGDGQVVQGVPAVVGRSQG